MKERQTRMLNMRGVANVCRTDAVVIHALREAF